uniref:adenylate dimethylallyltransferase (ADP/ATP-dependent) n=1 Tax=Solanum lycopersicum TaxID=4081 RepID=A0A3Q7IUF0_SOLLC
MDRYLREEINIDGDDESKKMILQGSISSIKRNTRILICNQLDKIQRLISEKMWSVHHIIVTDVFKEDKEEDTDEAWTNTVLQPYLDIVKRFLKSDHHNIIIECEIEPDSDFTAEDFCLQAVVYIEKIQKTQRVPIIVGGSNSYIEKLVEDPVFMFKYKYDSCFIWIDVEQSVLNRRVDMRVDQMVKAGLVDEVRQIFIPDADYTKGIRRSIGVPEMDRYLREEINIDGDDESKKMILQGSISSIKRNTRMLICNQLDKIQRLISEKMWSVHHIIATDVFKEDKEEDTDEAWTNTVLQPCLDIVKRFLKSDHHNIIIECEIEPDSDFTAEDFCLQAVVYIEKIQKTQRVPIIVGGSNSYIEKLVEDPVFMFKYKYDSCFIWIDVEQSVLNRRVDMRVDQMVKAGLVDEVRQIFIPDADYTKGIRRSIGVPEMDIYLREETNIDGDDESKKMILQASISSIKRNTRMLICNQLDKIQRLISEKMWSVHHIIATDVFKEDKEEDTDEAWTNTVLQPCLDIVKRFLKSDHHNIIIECT